MIMLQNQHLSSFTQVHLSICVSAHLSVYLSTCLSVCSPVCPCVLQLQVAPPTQTWLQWQQTPQVQTQVTWQINCTSSSAVEISAFVCSVVLFSDHVLNPRIRPPSHRHFSMTSHVQRCFVLSSTHVISHQERFKSSTPPALCF